jgi:hypothetical protein
MAALVTAMGRLGRVSAMGRAAGVGDGARLVGRRLSAAQHRPPSEAVGGELGPLVVLVVEAEGVESLADGAAIRHARGAARPRVRNPAR